MYCRKCGGQIPDDSVFCSKCGMKLQEAAVPAQPKPAQPLTPQRPAAAPAMEQPLWEGRFSGRSLGHWYVLWILWACVVGWIFVFKIADKTMFVTVAFLVMTFLPLLYLEFVRLKNRWTVKYKLTTHRLFREQGLISRTVSEIELIRVDDVAVRQGILQRIFNVGDVTVISTDAMEPKLILRGIDKPIETKELIRTQVRTRRDKALFMENI